MNDIPNEIMSKDRKGDQSNAIIVRKVLWRKKIHKKRNQKQTKKTNEKSKKKKIFINR